MAWAEVDVWQLDDGAEIEDGKAWVNTANVVAVVWAGEAAARVYLVGLVGEMGYWLVKGSAECVKSKLEDAEQGHRPSG